MNAIENGKYIGRVVDVTATTSKAGNPMIVIEWDVDGRIRRKSYHVVANAAGTPNERNIRTLRAVFTSWDGSSTDWFAENYDECLQVAAQLVILNEEYNGSLMPSVKYVNPLPTGAAVRSAVSVLPPPSRPPVKPQGALPDTIEPALESVWGAYVALHAGEDYPTLEKGWFELLDRTVVPQKDQDLYSEYDWRMVAAALRESAKAADGKEVR